MEIEWKGKIGYGDIISPICYAHNESIRRQESVNLKFYWEHSEGTKFKPQDPETINERTEFIFKHTEPLDSVTLENVYNHKINYPHTNYDDSNLGLHNLRFSNTFSWNGKDNYVAIVSSLNNKKQFKDYAPHKLWKDPLAGRWSEYIENLSKDYKLEFIGYETPIREACEILQRCSLLVSYHGSLAWTGRWIGVPSIIYSTSDLTSKCFTWSIRKDKEFYFDLEEVQTESLRRLEDTKQKLQEYLVDSDNG